MFDQLWMFAAGRQTRMDSCTGLNTRFLIEAEHILARRVVYVGKWLEEDYAAVPALVTLPSDQDFHALAIRGKIHEQPGVFTDSLQVWEKALAARTG
jgi:hypothetical protein